MKTSWNILIAFTVLALGLTAGGVALHASAAPSKNESTMRRARAAAVELVRAQERFRIAYLMDTGACTREASCSTGVRPNIAGRDAMVLQINIRTAIQVCEVGCDERFKPDTDAWKQCRAGCSGNARVQ